MAALSLNLGILNLMPIPILDGGNILLLALEGIRRRDFSLTFKERFIQVGLVFLLVLFAYVMYNDVVRLLPSIPEVHGRRTFSPERSRRAAVFRVRFFFSPSPASLVFVGAGLARPALGALSNVAAAFRRLPVLFCLLWNP